jgi:hypothetical protein
VCVEDGDHPDLEDNEHPDAIVCVRHAEDGSHVATSVEVSRHVDGDGEDGSLVAAAVVWCRRRCT